MLEYPPIIGLTETWLKAHNNEMYALSRYHIISESRPNRSRGGVALQIKEHISFVGRVNLANKLGETAESMFLGIK